MSLDRFTAYRDLRQELGAALNVLCKHWEFNSVNVDYDEWELEVRLGELQRHAPPPPDSRERGEEQYHVLVRDRAVRFDAHVADKIFLGLFHALCIEAARGRHRVTSSVYTTVDRGELKRTIHTDTHVRCFEQAKTPLRAHVDFERNVASNRARWSFDMRIATSAETPPVAIECHTIEARSDAVRRQRRRITMDVAPLWHVDFTRLDEGRAHQIELELAWPHAYTSTLRAYTALAVKPSEFSAYLSHCVVEQFIGAVEHLNKLCVHL